MSHRAQTEVHPQLGDPVFTADGEQLGVVDETRPEHFKVDAPRQPDYWLERALIREIDARGVHMNFPASELDKRRWADPGADRVVPATSLEPSHIADASKDEANLLYEPGAEGEAPRGY